jgi:hypothetical protein
VTAACLPFVGQFLSQLGSAPVGADLGDKPSEFRQVPRHGVPHDVEIDIK